MKALLLATFFLATSVLFAQVDTVTIGFGNLSSGITTSSSDSTSNADISLNRNGFLPNRAAAVQFLRQATLGYSDTDIDEVMSMGIEEWIDTQFNKSRLYNLTDKLYQLHQISINGSGDPNAFPGQSLWRSSWYDYHMKSEDLLRQRVAFALSEILVVSEKSSAGFSYGLADYYDRLLNNSFDNFRNLMRDVTYSPTMGVFLTYMRNPKSDTTANRFPDENYAREVMQLFSIGLYELNLDGSRKLDGQGNPIPTYDNNTIAEFSKIFTGLGWHGGSSFWSGTSGHSSWTNDMIMWNDYHEPGVKHLLNNAQIQTNPIDGNAEIAYALDNLFNHENVAPFICYRLIQRLVTSNPSQEYVSTVASVFNNNGQGVRGDLKAVIKAILLHEEARACSNCDDDFHGKLSEPIVRYMQLNKIFQVSTTSGNYRNAFYSLDKYFGQKPLGAPSVFNWFQSDYQPIGDIAGNHKVAPEFQITNSQSILGYMNRLQHILIHNDIAEEWNLYSGEPDSLLQRDVAQIDYGMLYDLTVDNKLHIFLDQLNLKLAGGNIPQSSLEIVKQAIIDEFPLNVSGYEEELRKRRLRFGLLLIMTHPDYLVTH